MINKSLILKSDSIGAMASSLCLLHCIATPLLFAIQPISIHTEVTPVWWKSLDYIFLLFSFFAVFRSTKSSSKIWMKYALWISWIILTLAILNEKMELLHLGELLIYIPAIALVFLHLYNSKYCQCVDENCCIN